MNRIQIPEGMGLEDFGHNLSGDMSSLGRKSKGGLFSRSPLRKLHKTIKAKTMPHAMMMAKKKKKKRGEPAEGAVAPTLTSWTVTGTDSEGQQFSESYPDQATAQAAASAAIAGGATNMQVISPFAPASAPPGSPVFYPSGSSSSAPARYDSGAPQASQAAPDVSPTPTGPQQSAAPTGPPPMPGHPQEVTAEPEGGAAPSSDGEADESPEEGEAPEAERQEAEPEEATAEPEESSEPAQEQEQQEESSSAEGIGKFIIDPKAPRRLMVQPPPSRPAWQSANLDRAFSAMKRNSPKLSGLSQAAPAAQAQGGAGGFFGVVLGFGAIAGLIYYLKKVKKT